MKYFCINYLFIDVDMQKRNKEMVGIIECLEKISLSG